MSSFFAFANTVAIRNFKGTNECHGWMGVKFQSHPRDDASQVIIHVRMLDTDAQAQQEALGIVGVNLCYGCFFLHHEPEKLMDSLLDQLTTGRIEIDLIDFKGIEFRYVDNRIMSMKLVQLGLSGAAMFGPDRQVLQPSDVLYKKAVLVERGSFRPVTHVNLDMMHAALEKYPTKTLKYICLVPGRIKVAGEKMSFNHLEKAIIRERFKETRVHFALNCASKSCPPLSTEPFTGSKLDAHLDRLTRDFINSPKGARVSADKKTVNLSKIFDWYKDDFAVAGGAVSFINKYRAKPIPADAKISYQEYNWNLNESK